MTPEWEIYEDSDGQEGTADAPTEELKPTLKANDEYVNVNIMIPCGSELSRGQVTERKRDIEVKTDGRASDTPILDTREYILKFKY